MARALIVLGVAAVLAGCGAPPSAPPPLRLQVFGDPVEIVAYRALIAAYQQENPGAKVELIPVGKQRDHMAKLATAFAAGDPPELFVLNFRRFGQFAAKGVLTPLGPAMSASGLWREADFYAPAVEAFRVGGQVMCLPQNVSSLVVYYNRALFRAAGVAYPSPHWTMGEFIRAALAIRAKARDEQGEKAWGVAFEPTLIRLAPFIWAFGGSLVDDTRNPTRITLHGDTLRALRTFKSLRDFRVAPSLRHYKAEHHDARFARGGLGMLLQSRRYTATLRQPGVAERLDWDVAPFPRVGKPVGVLHADAYCQAAGARDPAAAQRFVAFALSEQGQALLTRSGRLVPSRRSVAESPVFLDPALPPASAQVFLDAIPDLRRTPTIAAWHEIESKADVLLEEWFYEPPTGGEEEGGQGLAEEVALAAQLRVALQPLLAAPAPAARP